MTSYLIDKKDIESLKTAKKKLKENKKFLKKKYANCTNPKNQMQDDVYSGKRRKKIYLEIEHRLKKIDLLLDGKTINDGNYPMKSLTPKDDKIAKSKDKYTKNINTFKKKAKKLYNKDDLHLYNKFILMAKKFISLFVKKERKLREFEVNINCPKRFTKSNAKNKYGLYIKSVNKYSK